MKLYKYEMHLHTSGGSSDASLSGAQAVEYYKKRGYDGLCVTDHFTGSTARPLDKSWDEQMDVFCSGYEDALHAAAGTDFKVFFGLEYSNSGNDFIFLDIDKAWLKKNPDMLDIPLKDLLIRVRRAGGFIIHAHPFLEDRWIEMIRLLPRQIDAVEVNNTGIEPEYNARAEWYAYSYGLKATGGSDLHHDDGSGRFTGGIYTTRPANSVKELTDMIRSGQTKVVYDTPNCPMMKLAR